MKSFTRNNDSSKQQKKPGLFAPGGLLGRAPKPGEVPVDELTSSQRKRLLLDLKRKQAKGVRYGGSRWQLPALAGVIVVSAVLSVSAMGVALTRPSTAQIDSVVSEALNTQGQNFPTGDAVMWAGQFMQTWGNWSSDDRESRQARLASFLASGVDEQAGWNGQGTQTMKFLSVNPDPDVLDEHHATVTAAYQTQDDTWRCVQIPVYAYQENEGAQWAFSLVSSPAPVGCAPRTGVAETAADVIGADGLQNDSDTASTLQREYFPGFFTAWGKSDSDQLKLYFDSGVTSQGLGGSVQTDPAPVISNVSLYVSSNGSAKDGQTHPATVTVAWTLPDGESSVTSTYLVQIRWDGQRWVQTVEPTVLPQDSSVGSSAAQISTPQGSSE